MHLPYTLTLADYNAALKLHSRQNLRRRVGSLFFSRVLPGIGSILLITEAFLAFAEKDYFSRNPPGLLVVPLVFLLLPAIQFNLVRKQFNQLFPLSDRGLSIDVSDEGVVCVNPGSSESRFLWSTIAEFAQDEKVTMLYVAKLKFLFFPTSAMSPAQRAELSDLVTRNMAAKQK